MKTKTRIARIALSFHLHPASRPVRSALLPMLVLAFTLGLVLMLPLCPAAGVDGIVFSDVPAAHPHHDAIYDLAGRGIVSGYTDGSFGPTKRCSASTLPRCWSRPRLIPYRKPTSVSSSPMCPRACPALHGCHRRSLPRSLHRRAGSLPRHPRQDRHYLRPLG